VERGEGTTGVDQFVLIERGKWPLLSKQCTAIAKAMDLTAEGKAQLLLLALSDKAPERRNQAQAACAWGVPHRIPTGQAPGVAGDVGYRCGAVATSQGEASALLSPTMDRARGLHLFTTNHA